MKATRGEIVALVLGVFGLVVALTGTEPHTAVASEREPSVAQERLMTPPAHMPAPPSEPVHAPASLAGTESDGDLAITVSRGTIRLFDYYLTTLGETDLAGVRMLVVAEVERRAPETAIEVLALFDRYVSYLEATRDIHASTIDDYFAQTLMLQLQHFGSDAEPLFGDDNAIAAQLLASARHE